MEYVSMFISLTCFCLLLMYITYNEKRELFERKSRSEFEEHTTNILNGIRELLNSVKHMHEHETDGED